MNDRAIGVVKWFNNARGYGFIDSSEHSEDIFVHYRNIRGDGFRSLNEGQQVEFNLSQGEKGLQAEDVLCV
jgi:CspA family cold shock protein